MRMKEKHTLCRNVVFVHTILRGSVETRVDYGVGCEQIIPVPPAVKYNKQVLPPQHLLGLTSFQVKIS
jgi:hypothetical protein